MGRKWSVSKSHSIWTQAKCKCRHTRRVFWDWICHLLGKFALHAADVLLLHLSIPDLVLHLSRLLRTAAEEQQARGQSIQPMNRPQVLQVVLLGQDKHDRVVPITSAWMHLNDRDGDKTEINYSLCSPLAIVQGWGVWSTHPSTGILIK